MRYHLLERIAQGFGANEPATLRVRVFRLVSAQTAILCPLVITPMNFAQHASLSVHLLSNLVGMLSAFFFWQSCRGRSYLAAFVVSTIMVLDIIWFLNAGSRGGVTYFFLPALLLTLGIFPGRAGWLFASGQVVQTVGLFVLEHFFPTWVTPYASDGDRILDHLTGIFAASVTTLAIASIILRDYNREQSRLAEIAAQLADSEQKYRIIFNATSDALFVHAADGRPIDLNERACTLFGFDRATGLRLTHNDCSLGVSPYSEIEARAKVELALAGFPQLFEWHSRRFNGELFWSEVALRAGDFAGERCVIAAVRDITSRKQALQQLQDNEERLRLAMQAAHQGWFEMNVQTGTGIVSEEYIRIIGYEPSTYRSSITDWLESVHPEDRENVRRGYRSCIAGNGTSSIEYRRKTASGEWKWIRTTGCIVERDAAGQPLKLIGTHADITERKGLERQLLHSQRLEAVGTLASGVAHDLNNILTPMLMGAGLLRDSLDNPEDRELMVMIEKGGRRGAAIVKQLLDFSRNVVADRSAINPAILAQEVAAMMRSTLPKEISIVETIQECSQHIEGDSTQLHQALLNLCVNARDAMPRGGTLTIGVETTVLTPHKEAGPGMRGDGSYIVLHVTDTGHGIPPEIQEKIFDPFFTTKAPGKGTGLGLASAHGIVTSHLGFIQFESVVDRGTTFRVFLPAKSGTGPVVTTVPAARPEGRPTPVTAGCILVVDDESAVATTTARLLNKSGFEAISVCSGAEALRVLQERKNGIQLVITDFMMPEMDGPTLLPLMRQIVPGLKVIGVSGLDQRSGGVDAGFDEILGKPYELATFLSTVRRVLKKD